MFRLSKSTEYAIRGVVFLAERSQVQPITVEEISRAERMPSSFLVKIFQTLVRKGILTSTRGRIGGLALSREPEDINLLEIVEAVEGPITPFMGLIFKGLCPENENCPVHDVWKDGVEKFLYVLRITTVQKILDKQKMLNYSLQAKTG